MSAKEVLMFETNGINGHEVTKYLPKKIPVEISSRIKALTLAILSANPIWKLRQLERLDGIPTEVSEILKINMRDLNKIYEADNMSITEPYESLEHARYEPWCDIYKNVIKNKLA